MALPFDPQDYDVGEKVFFSGNGVEECAIVVTNYWPFKIRLSSGHIEIADPEEVRPVKE